MTRKVYPTDVSDDEWAFAAPYLTLMSEDAPRRVHDLRDVFNGLHWLVRTGASWRMMPHDLPPQAAIYQQAQHRIQAGVFEAVVHGVNGCAWRRVATPSPRRPFWTAAPCNPHRKVVVGRAPMAPNATLRRTAQRCRHAGGVWRKASAAAKCMWRWTRSGSYSPCT